MRRRRMDPRVKPGGDLYEAAGRVGNAKRAHVMRTAGSNVSEGAEPDVGAALRAFAHPTLCSAIVVIPGSRIPGAAQHEASRVGKAKRAHVMPTA